MVFIIGLKQKQNEKLFCLTQKKNEKNSNCYFENEQEKRPRFLLDWNFKLTTIIQIMNKFLVILIDDSIIIIFFHYATSCCCYYNFNLSQLQQKNCHLFVHCKHPL